MILSKLIFLFVLVPIVELYVLLEIGKKIGIFSTIAIIIITGITGAYLIKKQGFYILFRVKNQMNEGIIPTDNLFEGLLVIIGGIFLITPGIISDIIGFLLVIPQSRFIVFKFVKQWLIVKLKVQGIYYTENAHE